MFVSIDFIYKCIYNIVMYIKNFRSRGEQKSINHTGEDRKMNDKTIRDLYLGKLHPEKSHGYKTETYTEHLAEFSRLYELVKAALPEENRDTLSLMIDEYNVSQSEMVTDAFVKGFELGVSLIAEGLLSGND